MTPRTPRGRRADDLATAALAQELAGTKLLQSISTQLIADQPIETLYECLAAAAAALLRSDFASMQMLVPTRNDGELRLLSHRGFSDEAAQNWAWVPRDAASSCGAAMRALDRVIVPDVEQCDFLRGTQSLRAHLDAGIRAAQSTPLFARDGRLVGMLSTHWRQPHVPPERALLLLDILARQAADVLERRRAETALRDAHALLERKVDERTRQVRDLLGRLVNSQEEERRRIAREIHDAMGQQITALRMNIELLARGSSGAHIVHAQQLAEELDRSIDFLAWELRPAAIADLGLSTALKTLVIEWSER
ncbi:MAG: GAF domain-containing protein, partial [Vicinamibacterales bacterium]